MNVPINVTLTRFEWAALNGAAAAWESVNEDHLTAGDAELARERQAIDRALAKVRLLVRPKL